VDALARSPTEGELTMNAVNPERSIFLVALELPTPAERAAYLKGACGPDLALIANVQELLAAHETGDDFLSNGPVDEPPGTLIGPYKLLQQIGEGGMGVVYMAEQEQPVRRKVALKIVKSGLDSAQVIARFEAERQALALMDHPNIAKVLDAGTTESGRPYFVMELVKGVPITRFCDEHQLTPRQRLELFIPVCQAVQHAHQKGIIHRDLKPSNVLVALYDDQPVPKVIDFGVAKATSQKLTERTLFTAFGSFIGTLEYMSPEQAKLNALDIDTRSDVYALGVLLYELLTGNTPLEHERLKQTALDELLRIIREDEPPKPSTRLSYSGERLATISAQRGTEPTRLGQVLRGELDWIVMRALEKKRTRRYETANGLAKDVERYLHDEPVEACPPTVSYKLRKFARKHKAGLAIAVGFGTLLMLGTAVSAWQAVRATQAEAVAVVHEQQANESALEAHEKEQEANQQRAAAVHSEQVAQQERDEAQRQRDEVRVLNERLQRTLYAAHMNLARHAWEDGGVVRVVELLKQHRPKPGEPDLRGFEWHYLNRLGHSELLTLKGHTSEIMNVAFSPDGKRLAAGSRGTWDGTKQTRVGAQVIVWDARTGQELLSLKGASASVAFSPDGKRLASSAADNTVKVWDAQTGREIRTFKGHADWVEHVTFSPDGKRLASASADTTVKVWDAQTGQEIRTFKGHADWVEHLTFSPDGKQLASVDDNTVKVWEAQTGQELFSFTGSHYSVAFSPDGKRLASPGGGGVRVWDAQTGQELLFLKGAGYDIAFSPDGKRLASGGSGWGTTLRIWDLQTGQEIRTLKGGSRRVVFSPDGQRLASSAPDNSVKVWDVQQDQEHRTLQASGEGSIAFSPDWRRLARAASDNTVQVREVQTGQLILTLKGHTVPVHGLAFSPDGKRLASGGGGERLPGGGFSRGPRSQGEVKVWDAQTGQELLSFNGLTGAAWNVAFSPDGKRLASDLKGPPDPSAFALKVWDAQTGQELLSLKGHKGPLAFSPDGKRLACALWRAGEGWVVGVCDGQTGQELLSTEWPLGGFGDVAFSPDGKRLASGGRELKVWDAQTGHELLSLKGHTANVDGLVFSPDGKRLASTSWDKTLRVWDAQTGQELLSLKAGNGNVVAFSPDGRRLAGSSGSTVKIWDATPLPEKP
jgi:WD40 repeat protein/serine/threonine protein kinase